MPNGPRQAKAEPLAEGLQGDQQPAHILGLLELLWFSCPIGSLGWFGGSGQFPIYPPRSGCCGLSLLRVAVLAAAVAVLAVALASAGAAAVCVLHSFSSGGATCMPKTKRQPLDVSLCSEILILFGCQNSSCLCCLRVMTPANSWPQPRGPFSCLPSNGRPFLRLTSLLPVRRSAKLAMSAKSKGLKPQASSPRGPQRAWGE